MQTLVVNVRNVSKDSYVYIGRPSVYGNPFVIGRDGSREQVISKFRTYFHGRINNDSVFRGEVEALRGKRLGCYCAPCACHGDVIKEYLEN